MSDTPHNKAGWRGKKHLDIFLLPDFLLVPLFCQIQPHPGQQESLNGAVRRVRLLGHRAGHRRIESGSGGGGRDGR